MNPTLSSSRPKLVPATLQTPAATPELSDEQLIAYAVKFHGYKIDPTGTKITTPCGQVISRNPDMPLGTSIHNTLRSLVLTDITAAQSR